MLPLLCFSFSQSSTAKKSGRYLSIHLLTAHIQPSATTNRKTTNDPQPGSALQLAGPQHKTTNEKMAETQDLEWEEWDSQSSPLSFGHHCLAGSFAGVVRDDDVSNFFVRSLCLSFGDHSPHAHKIIRFDIDCNAWHWYYSWYFFWFSPSAGNQLFINRALLIVHSHWRTEWGEHNRLIVPSSNYQLCLNDVYGNWNWFVFMVVNNSG